MGAVVPNLLTVGPSGSQADYNTVQAALDSISDNAFDNPYQIGVFPGNYATAGFDVTKSYVEIRGSGRSTRLNVGTQNSVNPNIGIGRGAGGPLERVTIRDLTISCTDTGVLGSQRGAIQRMTVDCRDLLLRDVDIHVLTPQDGRTATLWGYYGGSTAAAARFDNCEIYTEAGGISCGLGGNFLYNTRVSLNGKLTSTYSGGHIGLFFGLAGQRVYCNQSFIGTGYINDSHTFLDGRAHEDEVKQPDDSDLIPVWCDGGTIILSDCQAFARIRDAAAGITVNALRATNGGVIRVFDGWPQNEIVGVTSNTGPNIVADGAEGDDGGRVEFYGPKFGASGMEDDQYITSPSTDVAPRSISASATLDNDCGGQLNVDASGGAVVVTAGTLTRLGTTLTMTKTESSLNQVSFVGAAGETVYGDADTIAFRGTFTVRKTERLVWQVL